ncbi:hypothetical protein PC113_g21612 [Phytophthora cactorum]|uniref:Uncharacterized protein n=1 Tax=Phytophthora cactorum TaxID=29920 RepID=A0A8T0Y539_9STRA|nr:hypothetical protein PC112_g21930 [Phytophthora cactorum]KAG2797498.1 hypothetical protein PC111_g21267 [Phytophthora cactorum]KAG2827507.1 hypothetical protein PC113_g21612 [Phytophthora cactorum]
MTSVKDGHIQVIACNVDVFTLLSYSIFSAVTNLSYTCSGFSKYLNRMYILE